MSALITLDRASELVPNFPVGDNNVLQNMVNAASLLIEKYCNRTFAVNTYDELLDGAGDYNLLLSNYPIVSITRVVTVPSNVLLVWNKDLTNSRAYVRLDGTADVPPQPKNVYLNSVKQGVITTHTIACSTLNTLADLAAAINGFASDGWYSQALGIYGQWPVQELRPPQGAFEARWQGACYLTLHTFSFASYEFRPETGEIVAPYYFTRGYRNYRVIYQAGFTDVNGNSYVPDPIQMACAELVEGMYNSRNINSNLQSESLGDYSYSQFAEKSFKNLSLTARYALEQFKCVRMAKYKIY